MWLYEQGAAAAKAWQDQRDLRALVSRFSLRRLAGRIRRAWVQEVPDDMAACEFGCLATDCRLGEWESCEQRRRFERSFG